MKGFSKMSILNWLGKVASSFRELEKTLSKEGWSGYIQLDGKEVSIKKKKKTIFIATDSKNGKTISYGVYDKEDKHNSFEFLSRVKKVYPCEVIGITSDFGRGKCFISVVRKVFPNAKHQICLVHFQRYIWLFIPRTKRSKYFWRNQVLKWMIKKIIMAENQEESLYWLYEFIKRRAFFKADYHIRFVNSVIRNYKYLTAYYKDSELINNSNLSENTNRQLERKLKNTDGFKKEDNLKNFLKIWFSYYKK
jgi:transposase-like protein